MKEKIIINIAKDFTKMPGGRFKKAGPFSGEEFRKEILKPKYQEAISKGTILQINFDGCFGFPSSFIDESFGGLAREIGDNKINRNMEFISEDQPGLIEEINKCINSATEEKIV